MNISPYASSETRVYGFNIAVYELCCYLKKSDELGLENQLCEDFFKNLEKLKNLNAVGKAITGSETILQETYKMYYLPAFPNVSLNYFFDYC